MTAPELAPATAPGPGLKMLMRSGAAARLAGLSPSTLRIWEHRYGVVAPPKTASGQRSYSMDDIARLRLVKQLTDAGYAIGTIAHLDTDALVGLSAEGRASPTGRRRVLLVGQTVARKLAARLRPMLSVVFDDLDNAELDVASTGAIDVLVLHVATLRDEVTERLLKLRERLPVSQAIVVYAFGREAVAEALRKTGVTVCREPISGTELARLIAAEPPTKATGHTEPSAAPISSRRFSDAELVTLTEVPSTIDCECPRHLAEIVSLLVGFERYSAECATRGEDDATLHRHLHGVTSAARSMLEQALARLVLEEGLVI